MLIFAIALATAIFGWLAVSAYRQMGYTWIYQIRLPDFERTWPGVMTMVELKKTPSLLLADGVKPEGVTFCACITPARVTKNKEKTRCMMDTVEESSLTENKGVYLGFDTAAHDVLGS